MLNQVNEELNKLIQRLEMLFQIQTHEVVQDLKKIRELLNNPEEVIYSPLASEWLWHWEERESLDIKQEVVEEQTNEVEQKEVILPFQTEIDNKIEWQKTREKEAKQFLKDNWVSNRKFLKGEKAINKAIELGFNI